MNDNVFIYLQTCLFSINTCFEHMQNTTLEANGWSPMKGIVDEHTNVQNMYQSKISKSWNEYKYLHHEMEL